MNLSFKYLYNKVIKNLLLVIILGQSFLFGLFAIYFNLRSNRFQEFVYLADAFLHGQSNFYYLPPSLQDTVFINGKYFWPQGIFPGIILMPFVWLGGILPWQSYLEIFLTLGIFYLAYKIARVRGYNKIDSWWLGFAFVFASLFAAIVYYSFVWQFAMCVSVLLSFLVLYEFLTKKRYFILGVLSACLLATRGTAALILVLVVLDLLFDRAILCNKKLINLIKLLGPVLLIGILIFWYNHFNFGNIWDMGHMQAAIEPPSQLLARAKYGLFSLASIPTGFYYSFLVPPSPIIDSDTLHLIPPYITLGQPVGFFYLSPLFLLIFKADARRFYIKLLWFTALVSTIVVLSWFFVSQNSLGSRFLIDTLPIYFLLLLEGISGYKLKFWHYLVIALSAWFNLYLLFTIVLL